MTLRIVAIALTVSICSCSKKLTAPLVGSVNFSVNGSSYNWTEQATGANYLTMDIYSSAAGAFHLNISNKFSGNLLPSRIVFITFHTATLTINTPFTYTNPAPVDPLFPPHQVAVATFAGNDLIHLYNASGTGDFATLTITALHDNMADGTFNAKLSRASDLSAVTVTNGTFKNVEIIP